MAAPFLRMRNAFWLERRRKGKKELVRAGLGIADECQSARIRQLCVAKQIADDVCGKHSTFGVITIIGKNSTVQSQSLFVLPAPFNVVLLVHNFQSR